MGILCKQLCAQEQVGLLVNCSIAMVTKKGGVVIWAVSLSAYNSPSSSQLILDLISAHTQIMKSVKCFDIILLNVQYLHQLSSLRHINS